MFVRRTQTRATADGQRYFTHRLVRSERCGARVRQRTLLNLGRRFSLSQTDWPLLCSRIEQQLSPQDALLSADIRPEVEQEAQRIAAQLLAARVPLTASAPEQNDGEAGERDFHNVDLASLQLLRPRSVGVEQLALWAIQQVQLIPLLARLGLSGPQRAAALGSIVARMAAPGSERATYRWLCHRSGLGELELTRFGGRVTSAVRDSVAERTVLPTEPVRQANGTRCRPSPGRGDGVEDGTLQPSGR